MKNKIFLLASAVVLTISCVAQEAESVDKKEKKKAAKTVSDASVSEKKKKEGKDQLLLDFTLDGWASQDSSAFGGAKMKPISRGFNIALLYDYPVTPNFSVAIGGCISSANVHSDAFVVNYSAVDSTSTPAYSSIEKYDETLQISGNKFSTTYGGAIAELRFRTKEDKNGFHWKMSVGAKVDNLLNVHSKWSNLSGKHKEFVFPNVTEWRYGVCARVGYGRINVSGYYSIAPLFEAGGKSPIINPYSIAITLTPF